MSENDSEIYLEGVQALVSVKVLDGNKKLLINSNNKEWLQKVLKSFKERYPDNNYVLQDFAVKVLRYEHTGIIIKWAKVPGFSLWQKKS